MSMPQKCYSVKLVKKKKKGKINPSRLPEFCIL